MKNPPRALLAKLFNHKASSALGTLGARHLIPPTLSPPGIPANHTGGLNQGHVESGEAPVVVPVYYGIETGQDVVLYLNDNIVDTRVVIDENQSLLTYIPARELPRGDSDNTVHYHAFTGFNGVNEEASYPVSVRVKTTVPGNPPGDPSEPGVNPYLNAPVDVTRTTPCTTALSPALIALPRRPPAPSACGSRPLCRATRRGGRASQGSTPICWRLWTFPRAFQIPTP